MTQAKKTAVVTGAASGIGLATANLLAKQGVQVTGVARSEKRCEEAKKKALNTIEFIPCDLSSGRSLRFLAQNIINRFDKIDMLIHCGGMQQSHYMTNDEGIEMQLAVNHLAPFVLTHELLSAIKKSKDARIIVITSMAHRNTRLDFHDIQHQKHYTGFGQYRRTKLMNLLFTAEFNRRAKGSMRAFAIDPGLVDTEFGEKGLTGLEGFFCRQFLKHGTQPEIPAQCISYLALSDNALKTDALCFKNCRPKKVDPYVYNEDAAVRLWDQTGRLGMTGKWEF